MISQPSSPLMTVQPVLETALDAVVMMSAEGLVADWNEVAEQTFGWSRVEAVGRNLAELVIPERFREAHWEGLQRYLETGDGPVLRRRIEVSALKRDGREFPVELSITPIQEAGRLMFLGFLRDITNRRLSQQMLEVRARDAELLFRVTTFAAETESLDEALATCLRTICEVTGWPLGHVFTMQGSEPTALARTTIWHPEGPDHFDALREISNELTLAPGVGMPGRILASGEPEWVSGAVSLTLTCLQSAGGGVRERLANFVQASPLSA